MLAQPYQQDGIKYLHQRLMDGGQFGAINDATVLAKAQRSFGIFFEKAIKFIQEAIDQGTSVLVHCNAGATRSTSVVCGYLMLSQQQKLDQVFPFVFDKRPIVDLNGYWRYLVDFVE